jgi:hypothetical protein
MSSLLKYAMVFAMILIGIIALSLCAECPLDACMQAFCSGTDGSRPPGRIVSGLTGACLSAASMALGLIAGASPRVCSAVAAFVRVPALLTASSLRI